MDYLTTIYWQCNEEGNSLSVFLVRNDQLNDDVLALKYDAEVENNETYTQRRTPTK